MNYFEVSELPVQEPNPNARTIEAGRGESNDLELSAEAESRSLSEQINSEWREWKCN
ncbi:MAG: hypothetical protein AAFX93_20470 [Verrucomicrobiota bacterium]